ncbi:hypothetical protein GCM10027347_01310 [Larkinella harenae]
MKLKTSLLALLLAVFSLSVLPVRAQQAPAELKEVEKIKSAISVLSDFGQMKENIPARLLEMSQGIVIVPKLINAGFVVGGKRGKGIALIRNKQGEWSDPVFVTLTGGSFGLQAGVQAVDLVLVFKNSKMLTEIDKNSFTLGGDLSVAAGPVGRSSSASTDYKLEAEVYSYSRSKGFFAGITLNGAALSVDDKANTVFYEDYTSPNTIFTVSNSASSEVQELKHTLKNLE